MRTASTMSSNEIAQEKIKQLRAENAALKELHIMQLAAVSTATVQNTETAIKDRIAPDNSYYTTAYGDTCRAVDREMRLRAENAALQDELKSVRSGSATICRELRAELDALRNRVAGYERVQEPLALRAETAEAELAALRAKLQDAELFEAYVQRFGDYRKSFDAKIAARAALADKEQKT